MPRTDLFYNLLQAVAFTCLLLPSLSSAQNDLQEKAVVPTCVTDAAGSSSCNIGVNPVPTYQSLDGGYQWLTDEIITTTVDGATTTETDHVFTATETNFLDVATITITQDGAPTTTVETHYVSWITAVPTIDGTAAAGAVIAGVVIAPALIASIQTVADAAVGRTVAEILIDLTRTLEGKATLTQGDLAGLANYIYNAVLAVAAVKVGSKLVVSAYWTAGTAPLTATQAPPSVTETSSAEPTITAIVKPPYVDWQSILSIEIGGDQIPLSDSDSSPSSSPPECSPTADGIDPGIANKLAVVFCTGSSLDFKQSESKTLDGSALDPNIDLRGTSIAFDYTFADGTCTNDCTANYASMIKSCQYDSHTINGGAKITDGCGTYAMKVSTAVIEQPAPGPRPEYTQSCIPTVSPNVAFTRDVGIDAINRGWSWGAFALTINEPKQASVNLLGHIIFKESLGWSDNQDGCNAKDPNFTVKFEDWKRLLVAAMDNCNTDTTTAKYGAMPLTWNGPGGCIDVNLSAQNP